MTQTALFTDMCTLPYQPGSETSHDAARTATHSAEHAKARVLALFQERGWVGATDDEIQIATGLSHNSARPRRIDLMHEGAVRDSGRTRPTRSGSKATVWVVA